VSDDPPGAAPGPGGDPARPARRLRVTVSPRRVKAGRRVRYRVTVTTRSGGTVTPVAGALVRFARMRAVTDRLGRAVVAARLNRPGHYRVTVVKTGMKAAAKTVGVRR
jgi:hypothetical protein